MRVYKYILATALLAATFTSCKKEVCPTPFCTMEFNLATVSSQYMPEDFPVKNIAAFLRNEENGKVYGPIDFDMSRAEITSGEPDVNGMETFKCKIAQELPYGTYTMWLWANVEDKDVYWRPDFSYSLMLQNNVPGGDYLLGKAREVSMSSRSASIDIDLVRLTAAVKVVADPTIDHSTALYISKVYRKVNALGEFSEPDFSLEFDNLDICPTIPPVVLYTFPTSGAESDKSEIHLSFVRQNASGSTQTPPITSEYQYERINAENYLELTFGTPTPPIP